MLWSVVLAAGAGRRLAPLTGGVPKQFWRPRGRRSLLDATLLRLRPLLPIDRTVVVVDRTHRAYVDRAPEAYGGAQMVWQPADRGTAAGALLGLLAGPHADDRARVVITPSDHGLRRPAVFRSRVRQALAHLEAHPDRVIVFGVEATEARTDYGWITPAGTQRASFIPVAEFVEKPGEAEARRLHAAGALWNTMVIVAAARTLLDIYRRQAPELAAALTEAATLPGPHREDRLMRAYAELQSVDLSRDLLTRAGNLWTAALPRTVGWSDLGTPDRLRAWMSARASIARPAAA